MSTPTPAVAPYVPTYANRSPYITPAEYLAAPTGVASTQIIPGQSPEQSVATLERTIARASSWADAICHQVLAATTDTQPGKYRVKPDRTVAVVCDYSPVIYVTGIATGTPQTLTAFTDLSGVWPNGKIVEFPAPANCAGGSDLYVVLTYVNGYANTTLAAQATVGAANVTVKSALGIVPGLMMRIDDGKNPAYLTVDVSYTVGSTVVPIAGLVPDTYPAGTSFSALPEAVKQATISLTTALIKTRGTQAVVMQSVGTPGPAPKKQALIESGGIADYNVAMTLLNDFIRRF